MNNLFKRRNFSEQEQQDYLNKVYFPNLEKQNLLDEEQTQNFKEKNKALYTLGANLATMFKGFSSQFKDGTLDLKEFNAQFDNLEEKLSDTKDRGMAIQTLNIAVQYLDASIKSSVQSMSNLNDKL